MSVNVNLLLQQLSPVHYLNEELETNGHLAKCAQGSGLTSPAIPLKTFDGKYFKNKCHVQWAAARYQRNPG